MRLVVAGGGTGGHLFPGIAVAEEFLARGKGNEALFVGTEHGIEARVLPRLGFQIEFISASGIRGKNFFSQIKGLLMLFYGYAQARRILKTYRPDRVLGVGGYASAPIVLAAGGMRIRRFIHEQNAIPGLTNKFLARFADRVFVSIEESEQFFPKEKTVLTGNPIRKEILAKVLKAGNAPKTSTDKEGSLLRGGDFRLLVFGGSAGAHSINMNIIAALPSLSRFRERVYITHQTGEKDLVEVREAYRRQGFRAEAIPFIDNMADAYSSADLIVCRAGATTVAEVTACGKPCIFIPYPHAVDDHQRRNAEALLKKSAGFMLLERELSGESLARLIGELIDNPESVAMTGRNAGKLGQLNAARVIVDEMMKEGR